MAYSWTVKVDTTPPTVNDPTTTGYVASVAVSDDGSGIDSVELYINDDLQAVSYTNSIDFDTSGLADGTYTLRTVTYDVAGNATRRKGDVTISHGNGGCTCGATSVDNDLRGYIVRKKDGDSNYKHISDGDANVTIGEYIELAVSLTQDVPNIENAIFAWTISGKRVKSYTPDVQSYSSGHIVPLQAPDLSTYSLYFYWHGAGNETVQCSLSSGGTSIIVNPQTFVVTGLSSCDIATTDNGRGHVPDDDQNRVEFASPPDDPAGSYWGPGI